MRFSRLATLAFLGLFGCSGCVRMIVARAEARHRLEQATTAPNQRAARRDGGETLKIAGLDVSVWSPPTTFSGKRPILIFSHGFHGSSTQSKFLMRDLANHGYMVFAPNHKDRGTGLLRGPEAEQPFQKPGAWDESTYKDRADDIRRLISALHADSAWNSAIDWDKLALAGHSLGGYTVLGLAGAWPSWKLPGVKAILALSPYSNPFLEKGTLGNIAVPVMYQGGTRDFGITPSVDKTGGAYDKTPSPASLMVLEGAGHLAWTDLNPRFQPTIERYCEAFLDRYVQHNASSEVSEKPSDVSIFKSK